jgi:hypothetical protein
MTTMATSSAERKSGPKFRAVCWQGWRVQLPRRWDPVKLEGDYSAGYALFADALRPRLGLKWQTPGQRKFDAAGAVRSAMNAEVGLLAADEARPLAMARGDWQASTLYIEPDPPGRDVWIAYSEISGRLLQVAYHAHRREHILAGMVLPSIADLSADRALPWAVFDLSCVIPGGMKLIGQRLHAGDLGLTFADRLQELTVRQIAVAQLALQRLPLDGWIKEQQRTTMRFYRPVGVMSDVTVKVDGREVQGRRARMARRRRYFWMRRRPVAFYTYALHDIDRDRIVILHGTDEPLIREIAGTLGAEVGGMTNANNDE